jgi:hypothetical protein
MRRIAPAVVLAALLAGCGNGSATQKTPCREEAGRAAEAALSMVRHYAGSVYPADVSYLGLKNSLELFDQYGCPSDVLGQALAERLTPAQRRTLIGVLPAEIAAKVQRALGSP